VLQDIRQQVAAGAQHISFGDPDFFNGIRHAMELVEEFHREFPSVTYDVTIKVEHLRKYEARLPKLKETGCLFVISAVEYLDDAVLRALDKGHTREDFLHVAGTFRSLGMTLHPTFVPFTQWTTLESYLDLLRVIHDESLIENVAPIQLGIRLLIPEGSRLLELDEVRRNVGPFDPQSLFYPWKHDDPQVDALSELFKLSPPRGIAEKNLALWSSRASGKRRMPLRDSTLQFFAGSRSPAAAVPFLSEPWYCCAEPTREQFISIGQVSKRPEEPMPATGSYV